MCLSWSFVNGRPCLRCALRKFRGYMYTKASMDMDMDGKFHIHGKNDENGQNAFVFGGSVPGPHMWAPLPL